MPRGIGFRPKFDISITVRDVPDDHASPVGKIFDKAISEVGQYARLTRGESLEMEADITVAAPNLNVKDMRDQMVARAMHATNGDKEAAAKMCGISVRQIYRLLSIKGEETLT